MHGQIPSIRSNKKEFEMKKKIPRPSRKHGTSVAHSAGPPAVPLGHARSGALWSRRGFHLKAQTEQTLELERSRGAASIRLPILFSLPRRRLPVVSPLARSPWHCTPPSSCSVSALRPSPPRPHSSPPPRVSAPPLSLYSPCLLAPRFSDRQWLELLMSEFTCSRMNPRFGFACSVILFLCSDLIYIISVYSRFFLLMLCVFISIWAEDSLKRESGAKVQHGNIQAAKVCALES